MYWIHSLRLDICWVDSVFGTHQLFHCLQFVFLCDGEVEERWNYSRLGFPQHCPETRDKYLICSFLLSSINEVNFPSSTYVLNISVFGVIKSRQPDRLWQGWDKKHKNSPCLLNQTSEKDLIQRWKTKENGVVGNNWNGNQGNPGPQTCVCKFLVYHFGPDFLFIILVTVISTSSSHAMKLIFVVKRLLSFLLVRSVSLIPEQDFIAEFHIFLVQDSLPSFLKVNIVNMTTATDIPTIKSWAFLNLKILQ